MEVQIISKETIKPSAPTPDHSRTYNLCLFDQLVPHIVYIPMLVFYSGKPENPRNHVSDYLKNSLSKALTYFYPFAGRIKDDLTIDCNDEGATFIEAQASCDMAFVLEDRENVEILQKLSPYQQHIGVAQPKSDQALLIVQVNYFTCGGIAVCVSVSHLISDASGIANFLKSWAAVTGGADKVDDGVIYDCSSLFPPRDISVYHKAMGLLHSKTHVNSSKAEVIGERFTFHGAKIAALRKEIQDALSNLYRPTRFESVMGLIWEALISATTDNSPILGVFIPVNLRNRLNPPLPQQCIGNVCGPVMMGAPVDDIINRTSLSKRIHESIKQMDDGYIRKTFTSPTADIDDCFPNSFMKKIEEFVENSSNIGMFFFTSWCRFPFYEIDFGWGKPVWFGSSMSNNRSGAFVDTIDGEGIEAWITLTKEEMAKFQQHPGILTYATFKPSI